MGAQTYGSRKRLPRLRVQAMDPAPAGRSRRVRQLCRLGGGWVCRQGCGCGASHRTVVVGSKVQVGSDNADKYETGSVNGVTHIAPPGFCGGVFSRTLVATRFGQMWTGGARWFRSPLLVLRAVPTESAVMRDRNATRGCVSAPARRREASATRAGGRSCRRRAARRSGRRQVRHGASAWVLSRPGVLGASPLRRRRWRRGSG